MGFFFEAMCVRDLRVFAEALNGKVYHYRDKTGLECDAVIHLRNGQYGLIEIKLGGDSLIKEGAQTLTALANQIDTTRMKSPAFKMILTATGDMHTDVQKMESILFLLDVLNNKEISKYHRGAFQHHSN